MQAQPQNISVDQAYKESLSLKDLEYRRKMLEMIGALQRSVNSQTINSTYGDPLITLLTQDVNKPVTPADKNIAKYVHSAYLAFTSPNESPQFKDRLNTVTQKLQNLKDSHNDNIAPTWRLVEFNKAFHSAKQADPLTKGQKALNVSLLVGFALLTLACIAISPAVPILAVHLAAFICAVVFGAFTGYSTVKLIQNRPTIFNPAPTVLQHANQASKRLSKVSPAPARHAGGYARV